MYTKQIEKNKTNVYHTLERKGQSTMASAHPTRVKFQDLESQENRNYQQNLKVSWRQSLVPSLPSRNKTWSQQLNITVKQISKFFDPFYFCLISLLCPINVFRESLREKCPNTELLSGPYLDTFHAVIVVSVEFQFLSTFVDRTPGAFQ